MTRNLQQAVKCLNEALTRLNASGGPTPHELREAEFAVHEALGRILKEERK
jgi:hypothetical protein